MHFVDPVLLGGSAVGYCGRILDWNGRLFSRGSPYIFDVRVRRFAIARDHPALLRNTTGTGPWFYPGGLILNHTCFANGP